MDSEIEAERARAPVPPGPPAARAIDAVKVYGTGDAAVRALDHATVEFLAHRFTAIMGPSGSGKSTLLHCLAGLDDLTSGKIVLGDTDITTLSEKQRTLIRRTKLGFIFQSYNLLPTLNVWENIMLPIYIAGATPDREWIDTVIDTVGLRERLTHLPSELSGGQLQRTAAARALATRPEIIFADEPTGNLDTRSGAELLDFLGRAVRDFHQTIIMVTHDPMAAGYADRVVFLGDGRIVEEMDEPTPDSVIDEMKTIGA